MSAFQRVGYSLILATLVMFVGCSTPKPEPVYGEVPGITAPLAGREGVEDPWATGVQPAAQPEQASVKAEQPTAEPKAAAAEPKAATADTESSELIVTPDESLRGTIVSVNDVGRFVVLKCPLGRMPQPNSVLFVYRQGLKVGEVTVTGPHQDDHTVADIRSGECRVNDEVRDR